MIVKKEILGVGITDASEDDILKYILTSLEKKSKPYFIVTPNPEIFVYANKHKDFATLLNSADVALNDGVGGTWASRFLGTPLQHRMTGTDLLQAICEEVSDRPITVGFLGARPGVAEKAAECLSSRYPGLKVVFAGSEWTDKNLHSTIHSLPSKVDILFVAFGFPKQEEWMKQHVDTGIFRVAMGVGGAFDYIAGVVPRAPVWLRSVGFEWLFRLIHQPWRMRRQLALIEFVWLVLREKLLSY